MLAQKCYLRCAVSEAKLIWDVIRITPQSLCCLGISCEAVTYALVWSSGFRPRTEKGVIGHRDTEPREKMAANFTKRRAATKTDPSAETLVVRKNVAPASRRHVGLDNSFRVNRTFCRLEAGAYIFSHDR